MEIPSFRESQGWGMKEKRAVQVIDDQVGRNLETRSEGGLHFSKDG